MCVTRSQRCLYLAYPVYVNIKMARKQYRNNNELRIPVRPE